MRDQAGVIRWLHLSSRRFLAVSNRARSAKRQDLARAHHAEAWAECLYAAALALATGKEIAPPGDWDLAEFPTAAPQKPGAGE